MIPAITLSSIVTVNVVINLRDGHRVETPSGEREPSQDSYQ